MLFFTLSAHAKLEMNPISFAFKLNGRFDQMIHSNATMPYKYISQNTPKSDICEITGTEITRYWSILPKTIAFILQNDGLFVWICLKFVWHCTHLSSKHPHPSENITFNFASHCNLLCEILLLFFRCAPIPWVTARAPFLRPPTNQREPLIHLWTER